MQILNPVEGRADDLPSKFPCRKTRVGDTLRTISPCGGGYGNPLERAPALVLEDVLDGYVSLEAARQDYSVAIDAPTLTVDAKETAALRSGVVNEGLGC